jgi:hypothetical protein
MMRSFLVLIGFWLGCGPLAAQHLVELRGAPDSKYRFADWSYTTKQSIMLDVFYVGVPGSNEFNFGGGYGIKLAPSLTLAPVAYAVIGKEGDQRGVKLGTLLFFDKDLWKGNLFFAHFEPVSGSVSSYQVLDTADLTRKVRGRWDAGISAGFFHSGGAWNPQVGPMTKRSDRYGAWAVSYRFGPQHEFRITRVLTFQ